MRRAGRALEVRQRGPTGTGGSVESSTTRAGEGATEPYVELPGAITPRARAVLVLHGGKAESRGPVEAGQLDGTCACSRSSAIRRRSATTSRSASSATATAGWNGPAADPVADVELRAPARIAERYGAVPVVLVGHSMGGRAALSRRPRTARSAAWWRWRPGSPGTEPVEQLAGRDLAVLHGTRDLTTRPRASAAASSQRAAPFTRRARLPAGAVERSRDAAARRVALAPPDRRDSSRAMVDDAPFDRHARLARAAGVHRLRHGRVGMNRASDLRDRATGRRRRRRRGRPDRRRTCCSGATTSRCSRPSRASAGTRTPTTSSRPTAGSADRHRLHRAQPAHLPQPAAAVRRARRARRRPPT